MKLHQLDLRSGTTPADSKTLPPRGKKKNNFPVYLMPVFIRPSQTHAGHLSSPLLSVVISIPPTGLTRYKEGCCRFLTKRFLYYACIASINPSKNNCSYWLLLLFPSPQSIYFHIYPHKFYASISINEYCY